MYEHGELKAVCPWEYESANCIYSDKEETNKLFNIIRFKTIGVYFTLSLYIVNGENSCMVNGSYPTLLQLANRFNMCRNTLVKHLKLLQEHNFLKVVKVSRQTKIVINPNIYFGRYITLDTYNLFKNN